MRHMMTRSGALTARPCLVAIHGMLFGNGPGRPRPVPLQNIPGIAIAVPYGRAGRDSLGHELHDCWISTISVEYGGRRAPPRWQCDSITVDSQLRATRAASIHSLSALETGARRDSWRKPRHRSLAAAKGKRNRPCLHMWSKGAPDSRQAGHGCLDSSSDATIAAKHFDATAEFRMACGVPRL